MNQPLILIVEDDKAVRNLIAATLDTQDYRYLTAGTGEQGLQEATLRQPDIVLLDLGLPDGDGVSIIRRIRTWSLMPIIVIAGAIPKINAPMSTTAPDRSTLRNGGMNGIGNSKYISTVAIAAKIAV